MRPEDKAQQLEMTERDSCISAIRSKVSKAAETPSALVCMNDGCSNEIPEARRKAYPGVQLCISCKTLSEKYGR